MIVFVKLLVHCFFSLYDRSTVIIHKLYVWSSSLYFHKFGAASYFGLCVRFNDKQCISIGNNVYIGSYSRIMSYSIFGTGVASICISDNVSIGEFSHITSINSIMIEEGVLIGRRVTISDNNHGLFSLIDLKNPPLSRKMTTKGPVRICKNVWIGENAIVLSGVTVGEGSIVAANSVVTHDVPSYSMVAGNPAKVIKRLN